MTYIDNDLYFSNVQDLGADGADAASDHWYDLGGEQRGILAGEVLTLVMVVDETFAGTHTTLTVEFVSDTAAPSGGPPEVWASATVHFSRLFAKAALTAGSAHIVGRTVPGAEMDRYFGVNYNFDAGTVTAGKVRTFLTRNVQEPLLGAGHEA